MKGPAGPAVRAQARPPAADQSARPYPLSPQPCRAEHHPQPGAHRKGRGLPARPRRNQRQERSRGDHRNGRSRRYRSWQSHRNAGHASQWSASRTARGRDRCTTRRTTRRGRDRCTPAPPAAPPAAAGTGAPPAARSPVHHPPHHPPRSRPVHPGCTRSHSFSAERRPRRAQRDGGPAQAGEGNHFDVEPIENHVNSLIRAQTFRSQLVRSNRVAVPMSSVDDRLN